MEGAEEPETKEAEEGDQDGAAQPSINEDEYDPRRRSSSGNLEGSPGSITNERQKTQQGFFLTPPHAMWTCFRQQKPQSPQRKQKEPDKPVSQHCHLWERLPTACLLGGTC